MVDLEGLEPSPSSMPWKGLSTTYSDPWKVFTENKRLIVICFPRVWDPVGHRGVPGDGNWDRFGPLDLEMNMATSEDLAAYIDSRVHKINEAEDSGRLDCDKARGMVYELLLIKDRFVTRKDSPLAGGLVDRSREPTSGVKATPRKEVAHEVITRASAHENTSLETQEAPVTQPPVEAGASQKHRREG